ncbi:hypothetical protein K461DRAFT_274509 [Myriangium duriaei CBS 260.36]|uniref:CinA C-terminal domain-containing protein n=1 Tax=Myriangium duriaei CBS 260.36 TaxID=1168546 RepID=A0A9P4J8S3_9PEZI|nr:hypothetical protein K461DRAFT_274509 [Myriangium duriaei CBS 260.36]
MAGISGFPPAQLAASVERLATHLKAANQTVSFAETATGGLLSSTLLSIPGTSKVFRGGLTLYTLESRVAFAGWTQSDIDKYKGPTTSIVEGLAKHVRGSLKADWVLAESGTAGPTGGTTRNRTPGYVALAVAGAGGNWTREVETGLGGDRVANMLRFAEEGVRLLLDVIEGRIEPDRDDQGGRL